MLRLLWGAISRHNRTKEPMTRKDYILIAAALKAARIATETDITVYALNATAHTVSDALALDNSRFDRIRFLKACGALS